MPMSMTTSNQRYK